MINRPTFSRLPLAVAAACALMVSVGTFGFHAAVKTAPVTTATAVVPTKVIYLGLENMSRTKAFANMPWLKGQAALNGDGTKVSHPRDPSLPNYLEQTFGKTFNITDDGNPKHHPLHGQTVYGAAVAKGRTAHVYAQDMVGNCELFDDVNGWYKVRHAGGLPYAIDERALCNTIHTPDASIHAAITNGTLPNVGWWAPSNRDNAHKPSTPAQADAWTKASVTELMNGADYKSGALVIIVSTDEGSGTGTSASIVPYVVWHLGTPHQVVTTPLDNVSLYHSFLRYGGTIVSGADDLGAFGL